MGVVNRDPMLLQSGLLLSNCYMCFTPGPIEFPNQPLPMNFQWTQDDDGIKAYQAVATMYIYTSREAKMSGSAPLEIRPMIVPAAATSAIVAGVFDFFYETIQAVLPNVYDVPPHP